jgi:hypothetical protein
MRYPTIHRLVAPAVVLAALVLGGCGDDAARSSDPAGLQTVFDSTGDTLRARVAGVVDSAALRGLTAEVRIVGEVNDSIIFGNAGMLTIGAAGDLVMFDFSSTQLLRFAPDGTLQGPVGRRGGGPGEYSQVSGLVGLPDSTWAVYDVSSSRVSIFGPDGVFRESWTLPSSTHFAQGMLGSDVRGGLWVSRYIPAADGDPAGAKEARMRVLEQGRVLADTVLRPTLGVVAPIYRAMRETPQSKSSTSMGDPFAANEQFRWSPDGHWVLLETGTYRLLFARRDAKPLVVERSAPAIPVDPDERAQQEEWTFFTMRSLDPSWTWQGPTLSTTRAPARSMFVARDGRVWVAVALPSEQIPEAERDQVRPERRSPERWRNRSAYEVFERSGRFLGRVTLPPRTSLYDANGDIVWGT